MALVLVVINRAAIAIASNAYYGLMDDVTYQIACERRCKHATIANGTMSSGTGTSHSFHKPWVVGSVSHLCPTS
jgi:hypothetical protein